MEAQAGAPLRGGRVFIGTLRRDLSIGIGIAMDEPGPHWLITSAIESIDVQTEKTATVKTRNSTYGVRDLDPDAPLDIKDLFLY